MGLRKQFEYYVQNNLSERYPDYDFTIAESANQPIWDIKGISQENGEEMLIQVKMMDTAQANHLSNIMQSNPDVYYATSSEIREKFSLQNRNYRNNLFQSISQVMNLHKMYKMDWKH